MPLLLAAAPHMATVADSEEGRCPLHAAFAAPSLVRRCGVPRADAVEAHAGAARQRRATTALQLLTVHRLIRAAPETALQQDKGGSTAAHLAATFASGANGVLQCEFGLLSLGVLINAAPSAAAVADGRGQKALDLMGDGLLSAALNLKPLFTRIRSRLANATAMRAALQPTAPADYVPLLSDLASQPRVAECTSTTTVETLTVPLPTFAAVVARQPLSAAEWQVVPGDDSCLASALPAVLQRSAEEARFLVARLPQVGAARAIGLALARLSWRVV